MKKGLFISFEGGEGVGKSTQIALLDDELQKRGFDTLQTREPGGTPEAERLRALFVDPDLGDWSVMEQALLITTARAHHLRTKIIPHLQAGGIVLCDRFIDSTRVYQGYAGELGDTVIRDLHKHYAHNLWPDMTLLLDLDPEIGMQRVGSRGGEEARQRFESYDLEFHRDLRAGFLSCAEQEPKRFHVLDAGLDAETLHDQVMQAVQGVL